jgi:hypothetical protein
MINDVEADKKVQDLLNNFDNLTKRQKRELRKHKDGPMMDTINELFDSNRKPNKSNKSKKKRRKKKIPVAADTIEEILTPKKEKKSNNRDQ